MFFIYKNPTFRIKLHSLCSGKDFRSINNDFESLYWTKHFSFILAVINVCPVLGPSELLLSTHLPTSEGWTAELTVGLWVVVPTTGIRTHASRPRMIRNTTP